THARRHLLESHRGFLSVGHDEYWSWHQRAHVEAARDRGIGLGFFGANAVYWQVRHEPSPMTGAPFLTMVAYKAMAQDKDPMFKDPKTHPLTTLRWRDPVIGRSEDALVGIFYNGIWPIHGDVKISDVSSWAMQGTGLQVGDTLPGLLG